MKSTMAELEQLKLGEKSETSSINEDRISSLPDSLLCHILSFLPTITSVTTTILSRRWRHLCKDLQVFYFDHYAYHRPRRFVAFVNTVLEKRRFRHIKKFHFSGNVTKHNSPDMWVRAAIGPLLQELHLHLHILSEGFDFPHVTTEQLDFPHGVFTCTSLVSLSLKGSIYLCDLPSVHLPSLKYLKLDINALGSIDVILSGCPVLETLVLNLDVIKTPAIHMPRSLKSLTFVQHCQYNTILEDVEIDTPCLEYLYISTWNICPPNLNLVSNVPNMVEVHLDASPERVGWVVELLKALCRTKLLVLKYSTTECLFWAPALDSLEFCCLLHLQIELLYFEPRCLINLLCNCPMLQVLKIDNQEEYICPDPTFESWSQATSVPNCVISELENIEFERYGGSSEEHAFIAYILQRGLVLKTMTIHTDVPGSQEDEHYVLKELSIIPRASDICQLEVDGIKL